MEERLVSFRPRAVLVVLGIILAAVVMIEIIQAARGILIWIFVAIFLALALNPAVDALQRRGVRRRGSPSRSSSSARSSRSSALAATFIPTLVDQVNDFVDAVPGYVDDLTTAAAGSASSSAKYHITERVRERARGGRRGEGARRLRHGARGDEERHHRRRRDADDRVPDPLHAARGPGLDRALLRPAPREKQPRWRAVGHDIYRTIGGYVTGNLLISLIAGIVSTLVLLVLGVPYAVALGLLVAILDLIPLAGATIAAIIVSTVAFLDSTARPGSSSSSSSSSTSSSRTTCSSRSSTAGRCSSRRSRC